MLDKIKTVIRNPSSLGERAMNSGMWNMVSLSISYPLRLSGNLIMTRILAPDAFALMAVVIALHTGLFLMSDVGIQQSVMRDKRGDDPEFLRVAWTVQIVRGFFIVAILLGLGALLYLYGPVLAAPNTVYADPLLPYMIWVSSFALLCRGFETANRLLAKRQMRLSGVISIELTGQVVGWCVMIAIGYMYATPWALLSAVLATTATTLILGHLLLRGPRMALRWDRAQVRDMWSFGKWLIGASAGEFLMNNLDRIIFAAMIDGRAFGVYVIASLWVDIARMGANQIGNSVFVPSFSAILNAGDRDLRPVLLRTFRYYAILMMAIFVALQLFMAFVLEHLYPEAYALAPLFGTVLAFRILPIAYNPFRGLLLSQKHSRYIALATCSSAVVTGIATYIAASSADFLWAVMAFGLGGAPMFLAFVAHPEARKYIDLRLHVVILSGIVGACTVTTLFLSGTLTLADVMPG